MAFGEKVVSDIMVGKIVWVCVVYLIGTIIDIYLYKKENYEYLIWNPNRKELSKYKNIQIEENGEHTDGELLIHSSKIIRGITMIKISENEDGKTFEEKFEICSRLVPQDAILIKTELPEGYPNLRLEWIDNNFYKCSVTLEYDGRVGNIREISFYKPIFTTFINAMITGKLIKDLIKLFK